jgi:hypothetical protein
MRFPVIHLLALKPYEGLRESPNPSLCSMFVEFPDGHQINCVRPAFLEKIQGLNLRR